jgi:hypothetical protein
MGQLVGVTEKATNQPGTLRFELNRTLSGQGHERFSTVEEARGDRPSAVLARRLIGHGGVDAVHVFSNIVTVELSRGSTGEGLTDIVSNLYQYWLPGVEPPSFEDLQPEEAAAPTTSGEGGEELSAAAQRVPAHLLERSKAAKERWAANNG